MKKQIITSDKKNKEKILVHWYSLAQIKTNAM